MGFNLGEELFYSNMIKVKGDNNIVISVAHFPRSIQLNMHKTWIERRRENQHCELLGNEFKEQSKGALQLTYYIERGPWKVAEDVKNCFLFLDAELSL